jgi:hypothetical protein
MLFRSLCIGPIGEAVHLFHGNIQMPAIVAQVHWSAAVWLEWLHANVVNGLLKTTVNTLLSIPGQAETCRPL